MAKTMKKKPAKSEKSCDCVKQLNEQLKERNCAITQEMLFDFSKHVGEMSGPSIRLHKLESGKRGSVPVLFCRFCPFCGKESSDG